MFLWIMIFLFGMILPLSSAQADEKQLVYDAHGKRDPFVPLVRTGAGTADDDSGIQSPEDVNIEGVMFDPQNGSSVVANGSVYEEGQMMGQVKLVKVLEDRVILSQDGVEVVKMIYDEDEEMLLGLNPKKKHKNA